jgi:hypothetical protein
MEIRETWNQGIIFVTLIDYRRWTLELNYDEMRTNIKDITFRPYITEDIKYKYNRQETQQIYLGNTTVLGKVTCFDPLYGAIIRPYIILRIVKYINC